MANRPRQSLMDYMVIGISPALIMVMVGSLLFYLVTVFYHGQHEGRLTFIFAMFVMAIVLIARISMEEGIEYATLFAIPLAIVTMMAMVRFVQIRGPLAEHSFVINLGLIALVWWSAHKLTWDCTLIDDKQPDPGEGLLQGMGFDGETVESQAAESASAVRANGEGASPDTPADSVAPLWWQRMVSKRHRPHTPGVWVVYYALAALPLFALGQWLIPANNSAAKLTAFRLLVAYVGSALGLLLTTSFLGLRRYLRQRHMEMPLDMAGLWLGIGTVMILVILFFCVFLPRPGAVVEMSQVPIHFSSPSQQRTHRQAFGDDGPEQPKRATKIRQNASKSESNAPASGQRAKKNGSSSTSSSDASRETSSKRANRDDKQNLSTAKRKPSSSDVTDEHTKRPRGSQPKTSGDARDGNGGKQSDKSSSAKAKSRSPRASATSPKSRESNKARDSDPQTRPSNGKEPKTNNSNSKASRGTSRVERDRPADARAQTNETQQQDSARSDEQSSERDFSESRSNSSPSAISRMTRAISGFFSSVGTLIKLLFWAILAAVLVYFAWKHWQRVLQAIRQLIDDIKNLLAALFGRERDRKVEEDQTSFGQQSVSFKPFSSFSDPFGSGTAGRYSTEQLVCYTFDALEAWARERGCPRQEEQTPLEFAQQLAVEHPQLGVEVQRVADLYSRITYGRQKVPADRQDDLQRLWQHMHATHTMPAPPPVRA